jgi:hypothetical protein
MIRSKETMKLCLVTPLALLVAALCLASNSAFADDTKVASTAATTTPDIATDNGIGPDEKIMQRLLGITVKLPKGAKYVPEAKRRAAIRAAWAAVEKEGSIAWASTPDAIERQFKTTALLMVYSFFESAWKTDAQGDCTEVMPDGSVRKGPCKSFGVMQVNGKFLGTSTVERVLKDPILGFRAGLAIIHDVIKQCPGKDGKLNIKLAMGRYETGGFCGGAMSDVEYRLAFLDFVP